MIAEQKQQDHHVQRSNIDLPVIDCKLSGWSPWSTCSASCGIGWKTRSRYIIQMPQNGGKLCDKKKLVKNNRCINLPPCPPNFNGSSSLKPPSFLQTNQFFTNNNYSKINHKGNNKQSNKISNNLSNKDWKVSTTTAGSSMMDDEDDSKFSRLLESETANNNNYNVNNNSLRFDNNNNNNNQFLSSNEMKVLGSTSFHVKNGFVYLISASNETSNNNSY